MQHSPPAVCTLTDFFPWSDFIKRKNDAATFSSKMAFELKLLTLPRLETGSLDFISIMEAAFMIMEVLKLTLENCDLWYQIF